MHIERYTVYNKPYLRLVASRRRITKNGREISGKELVLSLGALEKHDDGKPDYLERLRASFREGRPLIKELEPYVAEAPKKRVTITFEDGDPLCFGEPKRLAATILDPVFAALQLDRLFASIKNSRKIKYDLQGIVRLLTYGRLLDPASKCATMKQSDSYYRSLVSSSNDDNVYDALDVISRNARQIITRMNTCIERALGKRTGSVYYDVTNFFFEISDPDKDACDENGEAIAKGLRKMGVSKENRRQPIVQLGLFLDDNGIPISFGMFPGNTLDHHTLRPAMKETVDTLNMGRFILVADGGMYSGTNMHHVTSAGNGYIVSKSLKKSRATEVKWALSPEGYISKSSAFRYKSRIVERTVVDENGGKHRIREKIVVYWSEAFYKRERHENESFLKFIEDLKEHPERFRISSANGKSLRRVMKKDVLDTKSGEVLDGSKIVALIDDEKIDRFKELMGYYQIASSELDMPDMEVQLREMKGTLETRPVFVRTKEHIHAHLMICFMALAMMRLIQRRTMQLPEIAEERKDLKWSYGIPGARLSKALVEWQVTELPGGYHQMQNAGNKDLEALLRAFGLTLERRLYTKGEIRKLKASVNVF